MWSKPVNFAALSLCLFLLVGTNVQQVSAAQDATHEDIKTAMYSFAHSLRDNLDKLERHERREKQSGEQIYNMLLTIASNQRDIFANEKARESVIKGLEHNMNEIIHSETEKAHHREDTKSLLENMNKQLVTGEEEIKSALVAEQESSDRLYRSLDDKVSAVSEQMNALQARFDALLQDRAPKSKATNDDIFDMLRTVGDVLQSSRAGGVPSSESSNVTSQLLQETKHAVLEAVKSLSDRLDDSDREREASEAKHTRTAESTRAFREDVQNSIRLMSDELKTLADVQKVLVQTADDVLDTKRRIEYSTHQIMMEVTAAVGDRSKETNESIQAGLERVVKTVLDAQSVGMANLSVKIETEISQVWRQIGIMYQTLTDSASTLATLQKQTDVFVNGTAVSVDGINNRVTEITTRMSEVDENLNYLLGRLSLVTQEFKEIKIGLGEALESIRIGLQTVQGNKTAVDLGPGPNPIDEEPLTDDVNPIALSKTVYTVT